MIYWLHMKGFMDFIRSQGVVGLAVGFILGGAVSKMVSSLVDDIVNPLLGVVLGAAGALDKAMISVGSVKVMWGSFVNSVIDFLIIALVVYVGVKILKIDKVDLKK